MPSWPGRGIAAQAAKQSLIQRLRDAERDIIYNEFNGAHSDYDGFGRDASDNNTLYFLAWLMF